jgi:hypothetical protein
MKSVKNSSGRGPKASSELKLPGVPAQPNTSKSGSPYQRMAYRPGGLSVPRRLIERAVETVIRRRLEKDWGRPVKRSEMRRDPTLPPITEHPFLRQLARTSRKTATAARPRAVKWPAGK